MVLIINTTVKTGLRVLCRKKYRPIQPPKNPPANASPCKTTSGTRSPPLFASDLSYPYMMKVARLIAASQIQIGFHRVKKDKTAPNSRTAPMATRLKVCFGERRAMGLIAHLRVNLLAVIRAARLATRILTLLTGRIRQFIGQRVYLRLFHTGCRFDLCRSLSR
jgi:hypothetical protein